MQLGARRERAPSFGTVIFRLSPRGAVGMYSPRPVGDGLNAVADAAMPSVIEIPDAQTPAMRLQRTHTSATALTHQQG